MPIAYTDDMQKGLRPRRSVRAAMAHEVMFYAIVQKEGLGLDKCVEEAKSRMSRYNVTPNMLVVPPQVCQSASSPTLSHCLYGRTCRLFPMHFIRFQISL